jgi:putative colanic acid biosysnthesis UDP-glucose lipid carrier transferase
MSKTFKSKTVNWILTVLADSLSFWGVYSFCIMLYNAGYFGYARSVFNVPLIEVIIAYFIFIFVLYNNGAYRKIRDFAEIQCLKSVIKGVLQTVLIYIVLAYTIKYQIPRIISLTFIFTIPIIVIFSRILVQLIEAKLFHHLNQENVLVYGVGNAGKAFLSAVEKLPTLPLNIVGFVDDRASAGEFSGNSIKILGELKDVESIIQKYRIEHIIVAVKEPKAEINLSLEDISSRHHIEISFHPTQKLFKSDSYRLKDVAGIPLLSTMQQDIDSKPFYDLFKRMIDFSLAFIGIIITLPLCLFIGLIIRINSSGPIIFTQFRIGLNGKPFKIFKFRTMKTDSKKYDHCPTDKDDIRITSFGRWLRKLSLDEIPQLINVLKGEMSLVGPRPEMPFIVDTYEPYEKKRLSVMPGITGFWQVSPARNTEIHDNPEYDLLYIENRDLSLDILILILTILFVFRSLTH